MITINRLFAPVQEPVNYEEGKRVYQWLDARTLIDPEGINILEVFSKFKVDTDFMEGFFESLIKYEGWSLMKIRAHFMFDSVAASAMFEKFCTEQIEQAEESSNVLGMIPGVADL